jgi:LmbE family N-acetylglucosaminyl deacetylase
MSKQIILVVVAHPDDEVLGCGGYLLKKSIEGHETHVLYMNNGNTRVGNHRSEIENQIQNVAKRLKFVAHIKDFVNNKFDTYSISNMADEIRQLINEIKPTIVLTHISNDLHQDHLVVNQAVMIASRFMPKSSVKMVMTFPTISSSEVNPSFDFRADALCDISDYIKEKIDAMDEYVYEQNAFSELRGKEGIEGWGRFYGMQINVPFAEGFRIERIVI